MDRLLCHATFKGAKLAVSNMFGALFKFKRRGKAWQAVRLAHLNLNLQGHALSDIMLPVRC
jgi:hypothetical protein